MLYYIQGGPKKTVPQNKIHHNIKSSKGMAIKICTHEFQPISDYVREFHVNWIKIYNLLSI